MPGLFDPLKVGDLELPNRILMAPLTRLRGTGDHFPTPIMIDYYKQRASAGLIITEGTPIDPMGVGYPQVPGLWSERHAELWKPITEAVHSAGGRIFAQIWHVGRVSDPVYLNGKLPVGPSAIAQHGHVSLIRPMKQYDAPRALDLDEIPGIIASYKSGAQHAKDAGFDGVELHGANGYLLDQFLESNSNHRTDAYGGSIENRARLMLEATDAVSEVFGAGRVGMHLSPRADGQCPGDANRAETFGYVATELGKRKIAFIMAREYEAPDWLGPQLKQQFGGVYVANERFTRESAEAAIQRGDADAVSFGVKYIANPDLVERFKQDAALNEPVPATFYLHGPEGYIDYPTL
ncbi:alkene reductase [Granulicella cerasi]|uniref:alkene reductase n=1 Tax=Granulicella cerasi TaxID=741063 RepID=UPI0021E0869F|nr:alkene reductase [Granulicella cerasi]